MSRKSLLFSIGMILAVLLVALGIVVLLLKHTPNFYRVASTPPGNERQQRSHEFVLTWGNMMNSIINRYEDGWGGVFTTDQMNSFLQEDFLRGFGGEENLPDGFHDLRIGFEENRLRLGCRYGTGIWSTVLSIDLRIWLVAGETNLVAMEVLSLRAGGVPISPQIILSYITEAARRSNIDVNWYRMKNNPVATLKLQADLRYPTIQLQRFELQQGQIVIVGRPVETPLGNSPVRAGSH